MWEWKGIKNIMKMEIISRGENGNTFLLIPSPDKTDLPMHNWQVN